jgi:hypothetical protein
MNGQEKDNEIAQGIYTAMYWEYDSRLGRRWNLDPKPQISISDYACFANNPILFTDPNGDEVGVGKSITENKKANKSFNAFAKTKEGTEFLGKYAKAGQTIGGVKFEKDGEFHSKGLDLNYNLQTKAGKNGGGETTGSFKFDDKANVIGGQIDVTLFAGKGWQTGNEDFNRVITTFHESFIHGSEFTSDYLDDKKFNNSGVSAKNKEGAGMFEMHYHHSKVRQDFTKNGYSAKNMFVQKAYSGILSVSNSWDLKMKPLEIQAAMWNFSGGLNLDPKTGENIDGKKTK